MIERDTENRKAQLRQREKDERYVRQATTYVEGAVRVLKDDARKATTATDRWRLGYATEQFLYKVTSELASLVYYLDYSEDDDDYMMQDYIRQHVAELHTALKRQAQYRKMENTKGRTPEEIAVIKAKAAEWLAEHEAAFSG